MQVAGDTDRFDYDCNMEWVRQNKQSVTSDLNRSGDFSHWKLFGRLTDRRSKKGPSWKRMR
jgi:hypothetical protein